MKQRFPTALLASWRVSRFAFVFCLFSRKGLIAQAPPGWLGDFLRWPGGLTRLTVALKPLVGSAFELRQCGGVRHLAGVVTRSHGGGVGVAEGPGGRLVDDARGGGQARSGTGCTVANGRVGQASA